jgi:hypothetical protein
MLFLCLCALGCRESKPEELRVFPVTGTLFINDTPAKGAMIKFYKEGHRGRVPTAIVRDDGAFSTSYYGVDDGAPEGSYDLLVIWMQEPAAGGLPVDQLRGQFCDPKRPAARISVVRGPNELNAIRLMTRN